MSPFTIDHLRKAERAMRDLESPLGGLCGIRIICNSQLTIKVPNKPHLEQLWDRRGNYHRRIAKKWESKFGWHYEPDPKFYFTRGVIGFSALYGGRLKSQSEQDTVICHPVAAAKLRAAISRQQHCA